MFQLLSDLPKLIRRKLDKNWSAIYQAGYVDASLNPTKIGMRRLFQVLSDNKDVLSGLADMAEQDLKDRKADREETK